MIESHPDLTIRTLSPKDHEALERIAQRDSASTLPQGTVLAAIAPGGAILAAISVESGALVADPFLSSAHAAGLLRVRARQLNADEPQPSRRRFRRGRSFRAALSSSPPGAGGRLLTLSETLARGLSAARAGPSSGRRS
ncbi:MAG: hypothetical protein ACR2OC_05690 [Solirubrobacterales bacterium]